MSKPKIVIEDSQKESNEDIFFKGNIVRSTITNNCVIVTNANHLSNNHRFEGFILGDAYPQYEDFPKTYYRQFKGKITIEI